MAALSAHRLSTGASRACLAGAFLVFQAGCAARTTGAAALPDRMFVGPLLTQERANWFRPCEAGPEDPLFWVTFTGESVRQIQAARSEGVALAGDTAFVQWRAARTDERMVGPGGPALLVRDIAEVRPVDRADWADCPSQTARDGVVASPPPSPPA